MRISKSKFTDMVGMRFSKMESCEIIRSAGYISMSIPLKVARELVIKLKEVTE